VADDQHAAVGMMQADRVERAPQPKDDVGPALAAGRAMVEFAEQAALLGLIGEFLADPAGGQPVPQAELALAQALVLDWALGTGGGAAAVADRGGGLRART
jgi:hypothetical protein